MDPQSLPLRKAYSDGLSDRVGPQPECGEISKLRLIRGREELGSSRLWDDGWTRLASFHVRSNCGVIGPVILWNCQVRSDPLGGQDFSARK